MNTSDKGNKKRRLGFILIAAGVILAAVVIGINLIDYAQNRSEIDKFRKRAGAAAVEAATDNGGKISAGNAEGGDGTDKAETKDGEEEKYYIEPPHTEYAENETIGIISIPKIDLEDIIKEGTGNRMLKKAVGHFTGTANPGCRGNCCIAGHRNYTFGRHFNRLDELEKGDEIIITTDTGEYTYIVQNLMIVEPDQAEVLDEKKGHELTLVTCTPLYIASHRLIIRAEQKPDRKER
ncbi:MAG: class D sortase [Eubacteriales bacterium]|nr:class D sortase [Eubacteriales bacterium]